MALLLLLLLLYLLKCWKFIHLTLYKIWANLLFWRHLSTLKVIWKLDINHPNHPWYKLAEKECNKTENREAKENLRDWSISGLAVCSRNIHCDGGAKRNRNPFSVYRISQSDYSSWFALLCVFMASVVPTHLKMNGGVWSISNRLQVFGSNGSGLEIFKLNPLVKISQA